MEQMMAHIHPDDREAMVLRRDVIRKLKGKPYPYRMRWNYGTEECPEWHTVSDTMDAISVATLGEVGQTLLNVIADIER
jgi:hypothetical protein